LREAAILLVTVRFVGSLRAVSKKAEITLTFGRSVSLRDAINSVVEHQPALSGVLIDLELGDPRKDVLMLVNEKDTSVLNGLETMLHDEDEVVFVPVVHGG